MTQIIKLYIIIWNLKCILWFLKGGVYIIYM